MAFSFNDAGGDGPEEFAHPAFSGEFGLFSETPLSFAGIPSNLHQQEHWSVDPKLGVVGFIPNQLAGPLCPPNSGDIMAMQHLAGDDRMSLDDYTPITQAQVDVLPLPGAAPPPPPPRRPPTREAWIRYKDDIKRLYLDEDRNVQQVMKIMGEDFDFHAT
jgi:hypothetical protein